MEYYYKKIELSENENLVFQVLDKYKGKEVKRWVILNELGWTSIRVGLLSRIIKKLERYGLFKVNFKYNKGVSLEIKPLYEDYKVVDFGKKKILWVRFRIPKP